MSIDSMTIIHLLLALGKLFNFSKLLFLYPKRGIESPFHRFLVRITQTSHGAWCLVHFKGFQSTNYNNNNYYHCYYYYSPDGL